MYWNRFDIVEAYYLFCRDYHVGIDDLYTRLCHIREYFKPAPNLEYDTLSENGQTIYDTLVVMLNLTNFEKF
jgi:hypothetical protein